MSEDSEILDPEERQPEAKGGESPSKRPAGAHGGNIFSRAGQFIRDVRSEMKRVSWPSMEDVRNTTIIVLANVIFFAAFLFLVDRGWGYTITGFGWLVNKVFGAA